MFSFPVSANIYEDDCMIYSCFYLNTTGLRYEGFYDKLLGLHKLKFKAWVLETGCLGMNHCSTTYKLYVVGQLKVSVPQFPQNGGDNRPHL